MNKCDLFKNHRLSLCQITNHLFLPLRSGPHRYYLFVFEQWLPFDDRNDIIEVDERCKFSIDDYKENPCGYERVPNKE